MPKLETEGKWLVHLNGGCKKTLVDTREDAESLAIDLIDAGAEREVTIRSWDDKQCVMYAQTDKGAEAVLIGTYEQVMSELHPAPKKIKGFSAR